MRKVEPQPAKEAARGGRRQPASEPPAPVPTSAAPAAAQKQPKAAVPAAVGTEPEEDEVEVTPRRKREHAAERRSRQRTNRIMIVAAMLAVVVGGGYLAVETLWPKDPLISATVPVHTVEARLGVPTRTSFEAERRGRLRELGYEPTQASELAVSASPNLYDHLRQIAALRDAPETSEFDLLTPRDPRPGFGGTATEEETPPVSGVSGVSSDEEEANQPALPADVESRRHSLSPDAYPPAGLADRRQYLVHLRNALNRPRGTKLDLEKAYILASMYYNPHLEPDTIRGALNSMASELYNRLAPQGDDGRRRVVTDSREQVRIVSEFMLHGLGPFKGWDVQEYHPGLIDHGTAPADQAYLASDTLANGPTHRNKASSTALNLLTLILVRKLAHDTKPTESDPDVYIPLYGVRLPDRTILRFDANGPWLPLPTEDGRSGPSYDRPMPRDPSATTLSVDDSIYTRNIEFLRNGNHYSAGDYIRRYGISDSDLTSGTYLHTLDDRQMFATVGFELARADVSTRTGEGYLRARAILEEWVLDRDDGSGRRWDGAARPQPQTSTPRGDPGMRDAYLLYADMLLHQADYEAIRRQLDENIVLRSNPGRMSEIRSLIAHHRGALESARAYLEDALRISPQNARAHLYMGDIDFLLDDGSLPPSLLGGDRDLLGRSIQHFDRAEALDNGTLTGQERFLLHYHRALAHMRRGNLLPALADLDRVAEINPTFSRTPVFAMVRDRLKLDRAFEVLESSSDVDDGETKFAAITFLGETLVLGADHRADLLRAAELVRSIDNIAAQWEMAKMLREKTGADHGRDAGAWRREIEAKIAAKG
jgi:tetratricopeptide (TPR) repeat protein